MENGEAYGIERLVEATGLERRTVLGIVRQYQQITGDEIARVSRRNFLTPVLSRHQYQQILGAIQAKDGRTYAEHFRSYLVDGESTPPSPRLVSVDTASFVQAISQLEILTEQVNKLASSAGTSPGAVSETGLGEKIEQLAGRLTAIEHAINTHVGALIQRVTALEESQAKVQQGQLEMQQGQAEMQKFLDALPAEIVERVGELTYGSYVGGEVEEGEGEE